MLLWLMNLGFAGGGGSVGSARNKGSRLPNDWERIRQQKPLPVLEVVPEKPKPPKIVEPAAERQERQERAELAQLTAGVESESLKLAAATARFHAEQSAMDSRAAADAAAKQAAILKRRRAEEELIILDFI